MPNFQLLFECVNRNCDFNELRLDIANAIASGLSELRNSFGYWEKVHFAQAIGSLARNMRRGREHSTSWLRLSLTSLELTYVPLNERDENYTPRNKQIEDLTFDDLIADIRALDGSAD